MASHSSDPVRIKARKAVQEMMDTYVEISKPEGKTYQYIMKKQNFSGYDVEVMSNLKLIDVDPSGKVTWELLITDFYGNLNGVMHGGAAGVIFDMATTTALCPLQRQNYWDFMGGVTRILQISYLRAVPINTIVRIYATVVQHGRTMALIRGTMTAQNDENVIYATCEHHKVHVPSQPEHLRLRDEMRRFRGGSQTDEEEKSEKAKL